MAKGNRGGKRNAGNMDEDIRANAQQNRTMTEKEFIDDIVKNYDQFTRGDLQGVVEAYAMSTGKDDEKLLREIDRQANNKAFVTQISKTLKDGKVVRVEEQETYRRGDYVETTGWAEFRIKNGKVQYRSNILKDTNWYDHPTFNKQTLMTHLKNLKKDGRTISI